MWICEFCGAVNDIQLEEPEVPTNPQLTYILESPQQVLESKAPNAIDDITVLFVIDISGSMCVT